MKFFADFFYLTGVIIFGAIKAALVYPYAFAVAVWRSAKKSAEKKK